MEITVQKLDIPAFVNEHLTVEFTVENEEDEPAETTLSVEILGYDGMYSAHMALTASHDF